MDYFLIDLDRTIKNGIPTYWKQNRHGYTTDRDEAGLFLWEIAWGIVQNDLDKSTVMISQQRVEKILE